MNTYRIASGITLLALVLLAGSAGATPFAYITNQISNTVSVIDTATNTITDTISVGSEPIGVAVNPAGTRVYVTNFNDGTISVIDTTTVPDTVIETVPVGTQPFGVAVNPSGTRVYVANSVDHTVSVIDTTIIPNTVTDTVNVGHDPYGVAVNPAGTRVYVANYYDGTVSVIDTTTIPNTVTDTVHVGFGAYGVAVNPAGTRVYVANTADSTVSVIDTTTAPNTVTDTILVGTNPFGVAVNPAGTRVYVANDGSYDVSVIDTTIVPITVIDTVPVGFHPTGVAVNPAGTRVYVANTADSTVSVIDTTTVPNTVTDTVTVGSSPAAFGLFIATFPTVSSINPDTGVRGTVVPVATIRGSNFATVGQVNVKFIEPGGGSFDATLVTVQDSNTINCQIPIPGAAVTGLYNIVVTNPNGQQGRLPSGFKVTYPAPTLSTIAPLQPNSGAQGVNVPFMISGSNFRTGVTARLTKPGYTIPLTVEYLPNAAWFRGSFSLLGASLGTYDLTVENPDHQSVTLTGAFTVTKTGLTVTGITPTSGVQGTTVSTTNLAGTGFTSLASVKITKSGGRTIDCIIVKVTSTKITCSCAIPSDFPLGTYNVVVMESSNPTTSLAAQLVNGFRVTLSPPTILTIVPNSYHLGGPPMESTITGSNFREGATVMLVGGKTTLKPTRVTVYSSTVIYCGFSSTSFTPTGFYDVVVTNGDTTSATLKSGYRIYK
jgi:YVTN family beta-propeller protein